MSDGINYALNWTVFVVNSPVTRPREEKFLISLKLTRITYRRRFAFYYSTNVSLHLTRSLRLRTFRLRNQRFHSKMLARLMLGSGASIYSLP